MKISPLYIAISVLIIFILVREGCNSASTNNLIKDITDYKTEVKTYQSINGVEVAQNKALMLDNQEQLKYLLSKNDTLNELVKSYKNLKTVTTINNITQIYNDSIWHDSIPCDFKPFQVKRDSLHYRFYGTIAPKYFKIDSLIIPDEISIIFGERKMGFLKQREYTAEVVHSNPLVKTTNIGQYSVKEKRKKIVLSISGGYGTSISSFKLEPQIGLYLGFPLISF